MLRSSLKQHLSTLEALGIDPSLRAENLEAKKYIELAKAIDSLSCGS